MPITPLHFGLLAPINHWLPRRISIFSFILVNLWIDSEAIMAWWGNAPLPSHDAMDHTFVGAACIAVLIGVFGIRSMPWVLGAFLGAFSHILLDAVVHPEMNPLTPVQEGNPFYMGWMSPLSFMLMPLLVWFTAQCVSSTLASVRRRLAASRERIPEPGA